MDDKIGILEVGKKAGITLIDMRKPHLQPSVDPVADLVYFGNGNDVDTVILDGNVVVRGGKILTVDVYEMLEKAQISDEIVRNKFYEK